MRTRIKVCGVTRKQDLQFAAKLGVDAVGLVFFSASPRYVTIEQAVEISAGLPAFVSVVGLFVNAPENTVRDTIRVVPVEQIQFHGDEPGEFCRSFGKPYIKAVQVSEGLNWRVLEQEYHDASGLLLDAYHPDYKGGTGQRFDWTLIPDSLKQPVILAGGLVPDNVGQAIRSVRPYGVDVSSGVELGKGIKSVEKMTAFAEEVYTSDRSEYYPGI